MDDRRGAANAWKGATMRRLREPARFVTAADVPGISLSSLFGSRRGNAADSFRSPDSFSTTALWKHFLPPAEQSVPIP